MPGIFGLITKMPCGWAQDQLRLMTQTLLHEPFYVNGVWTESSSGVHVGWTARKGSADATLPLCNERDDITLIFSGEEFPDTDTRRRLKENGHTVAPGPLSHLVHLYEEDPSFFRTLNGRFQGVLTDRTTGTTTLFNDRFGLQRIYYHESKEAFYFAAEAKAILAVRPELREINAKAMGEYIACGCVMENHTLFENSSPSTCVLMGFPARSTGEETVLFRAARVGKPTACPAGGLLSKTRRYFLAECAALFRRRRTNGDVAYRRT